MKTYVRLVCCGLSFIFWAGMTTNSQAQDGIAENPIEAHSLNGAPLQRLQFSFEVKEKLETQLEQAKQSLDNNPSDPENLIWYGRRLAYLSRFKESVEVFTTGVQQFPQDARFLRHRGHRWITLRQFQRAVEDLEGAAKLVADQPDQVEPDGQPNAAGTPTSTLQTNIWYHLGLARFLLGDFEQAEQAFQTCLGLADNDDMRVATLDWLYMTLCRLERKEEADALIQSVQPDMKILENHAYHRRLLLYRGLLEPSDLLGETQAANAQSQDRDVELATNGFGVGHWYLINGNPDEAIKIFRQVTAGKNWAAFGYIAAEVELHRMK